LGGWNIGKVYGEPIDSGFEVQPQCVDDQVDGTATAGSEMPVHKLGARDRDVSHRGVPFVVVKTIGLSADQG
jgi:hypothetical protein